MSRFYDFDYRLPDGSSLTVRASGNTRRSAERWARYALREDHGQDPARCVRLATTFVSPEHENGP